MKDEKLTSGVVDEERGDHGGDVGIGCVESAEADQQVARKGSKEEGDQRNGVEEHEFVMPFMLTGFENEQDVEDICGEVGEHETDALINPVVPQANGFGNRADIQIQQAEQFGKGIAFGQRRKSQPGKQEKDGHIHDRRRAAAHSVFNELNERVFLLGQKSADVFFHKRGVCL